MSVATETVPVAEVPARIRANPLPLRGYIGMAMIALCLAVAILAPWIAPFEPNKSNLMALMSPPSFSTGHWLGTDDLGRDILSRILMARSR